MPSGLISGQISFGGLGSGTDFNTLIEGLLKVEQRRVTSLETWKKSWEDKVTEFKDLNAKMLELRTTLQKFSTVGTFLPRTASSTNTGVVTASANGNAVPGSHTIEVNSLASSDIHITASGVSSLHESIFTAQSDFTFSYAGTSYTISNFTTDTDLDYLVHTINSNPETKNLVRASTVFDGTNYHLQLSGKNTGADNQIIISNTGSMIFQPSDFNQTQDATNAQIRVNGFPSAAGGWIESKTNTLNNVIDGVALNLKSASPGTSVTVQIGTDPDKLKENIEEFVESVNIIRKKIIDITAIDSTDTSANPNGNDNVPSVKGSILTGNYGVQMISQQLNDLVAQKSTGFDYYNQDTLEGDFYSALSQIGITTDADQGSPTFGQLVIEYDNEDPEKRFRTLNHALATDPEGIAYLFAAKMDGQSKSSDISFVSFIEGQTTPGDYEISFVTDATGVTSATINGEPANISSDGLTITGQFGTAAAGMQVKLTNFQPNTTITGEVAVKSGKVNELIHALGPLTQPYHDFGADEDSVSDLIEGGPLNVLIHNYGDIMNSIDKKIAFEEERIAKMEYNLRLKFSRLDTVLQKYQGIQTSLNSQLQQLSK